MKDAKTPAARIPRRRHGGQNAAALFAEDGAVELPFLHSVGIPWRHRGRQAISELQASLAGLYLDFAFKPEDTHVLIDTPEQGVRRIHGPPDGGGDRALRPSPICWPSRGRERPDQAAAGISEPVRRGPGSPVRRRQGSARSGEGDLLGAPRLPELRSSIISEGLAAGALRPAIAKVFPFGEIVVAHRYLEGGEQIGKVIVTV